MNVGCLPSSEVCAKHLRCIHPLSPYSARAGGDCRAAGGGGGRRRRARRLSAARGSVAHAGGQPAAGHSRGAGLLGVGAQEAAARGGAPATTHGRLQTVCVGNGMREGWALSCQRVRGEGGITHIEALVDVVACCPRCLRPVQGGPGAAAAAALRAARVHRVRGGAGAGAGVLRLRDAGPGAAGAAGGSETQVRRCTAEVQGARGALEMGR